MRTKVLLTDGWRYGVTDKWAAVSISGICVLRNLPENVCFWSSAQLPACVASG